MNRPINLKVLVWPIKQQASTLGMDWLEIVELFFFVRQIKLNQTSSRKLSHLN